MSFAQISLRANVTQLQQLTLWISSSAYSQILDETEKKIRKGKTLQLIFSTVSDGEKSFERFLGGKTRLKVLALWGLASRGLYCKTFYSCNSLGTVVSYSVCHFVSLSAKSNIFGPGQEPNRKGLEHCPQILGQCEVANTLAYFGMDLITSVKSFIIQASVLKRFAKINSN